MVRDIVRILVRSVINGPVAGQLVPMRLRRWALRRWGVQIASDALLYPRFIFSTPQVSIGSRTVLNWNTILEAASPITIGERVGFGIGVSVYTSTHDVGDRVRRMGRDHSLPVTIGDACWLGAGVIVLPGVTIGEGCIVAAGAVVSKDCAPHGLYGGVPAKRLRELD